MTGFDFSFAGTTLTALGAGALWWPNMRMLVVSDLHLGKSERHARRGGGPLPPYETADTLQRLSQLIAQSDPACVICLGDTFDDLAAAQALSTQERALLHDLIGARRWIWIEGNHDPAPTDFGGEHHSALNIGPLTFRHIADPETQGEVSGHYHPKARVRSTSRPAFLVDPARVILPAFGTYTGGLRSTDPALTTLMSPNALAILTGPRPLPVPMPR
ncbi:ligase-associated DNA damage response endonuclease PdeM [Epibacterium ulvae]|uniref:ligase-associated DNA damage response endonuclease PdeM n=1 Tax=Epibacterium ulvae TaxID=1156985 RepID=UPI001BFCB934|nr:ligase-associated DNA damage response endonuclease PdeM [Epibacterium ulvae]MBT8153014.1 ligase-associated DNA damage response endonuclease PdeM [Epibacterium ulvae]